MTCDHFFNAILLPFGHPNASLFASSTCRYLRLLVSPFGQGLKAMHNQSLYLYFLFQFVPLVFIARVRKTHFQITLHFILVQNLVIVLASIFYIQGCNTKEAGKPLPSECNRCRVAKDINTKECVAECKEPNFLTAQKLCISKSGKLFEHHCNEICAHCTQQSVSFNSLFQYGLQVKSRMDSGFGG